MEEFISKLMGFVEHNQDISYSCFAFDTKRKIGTKVGLTSEQINEFMTDCLEYLCKKNFSKLQLGKYPTATPKEFVETIECGDPQVSSELSHLFRIPLDSETNFTDLSKYNAYMLILENAQCKHYFFTKKKPFINYKNKNFLFAMLSNNKYEVIPSNAIRLIKHFDCIILDSTCYITSLFGRNLLGLNDVAVEKSLYNKRRLLQEGIVHDSFVDFIETYMKKPGKSYCLAEVNEYLMQTFSRITQNNRDSISKKYRINIISHSDGKFYVDISDEKKLEDFIATLTNKRGKNFEDETVTTKASFTKS